MGGFYVSTITIIQALPCVHNCIKALQNGDPIKSAFLEVVETNR